MIQEFILKSWFFRLQPVLIQFLPLIYLSGTWTGLHLATQKSRNVNPWGSSRTFVSVRWDWGGCSHTSEEAAHLEPQKRV